MAAHVVETNVIRVNNAVGWTARILAALVQSHQTDVGAAALRGLILFARDFLDDIHAQRSGIELASGAKSGCNAVDILPLEVPSGETGTCVARLD